MGHRMFWLAVCCMVPGLELSRVEDPCFPCVCQGTVADCSHRNLTRVPNLPRYLRTLNLTANIIATLGPGALSNYSSLEVLDLSANQLGKLAKQSFAGLANLTELYLNGNQLKYLPGVYPPSVFRPLHRLQRLWLQDNIGHGHRTNFTYPDAALSSLTSLEELRLDGLEVLELGQGFSRMRNLTNLSLSSGQCFTTTLTSSSFKNVPGIQNLSLARCQLDCIDREAFSPLTELRELDLCENQNLTLEKAGESLYGLQNSSLAVLDLSKVEHTFAIGVVVRARHIRYLSSLPLKTLRANSNRIRRLEPDVPQLLPKTLETVSVEDNAFTFGQYVFRLAEMTSVQVLDIAWQSQTHVPHFRRTRQSSGRVSATGEPLLIHVPPNVTDVDMSWSSMGTFITGIQFTENIVQRLNLTFCNFNGWLGPLEGVEHLQVLDLSHNYCAELGPVFFQNMTSLVELHVGYNFLGFTLPADSTPFTEQRSLRILRMGFNKIFRLPDYVFRGLDKVEELYLNNNEMNYWHADLSHMKSLRLLDLRHNFLEQIAPSFRHLLASLAPPGHGKLTLSMGQNNLYCTCYTLPFWKWLDSSSSSRIQVEGVWNTSCKDSASLDTRFVDYDDVVSQLEVGCGHYAALFFGLLVTALSALSLVIAAVVYRYRWKLRYLYYMARWKQQQRQREEEEEEGGDSYQYDAFISYADEDRGFVLQDMRRRLQEEAGLRLCIHHIHFRPGEPIVENILQAVRSSRRTIAVISPDFLDSYWCDYEVQMAQMEEVYGRRSVLLVLLYRPVSRQRLSPTLFHVIRRDSYLEYPAQLTCTPASAAAAADVHGDSQDLEVFWQSLKQALRDGGQP